MTFRIRCGCDECVQSRSEDSLRHSRSRINAYRALASPSLIALSSKDPILTAFELSWELRRLSFLEHEFKVKLLFGFVWAICYQLFERFERLTTYKYNIDGKFILPNTEYTQTYPAQYGYDVLLQSEYQELRRQCQDFATALLDHTRTSNELEVMLNHDPTGPIFEHGERMHLNRLKLAIKLRQKKVCFFPPLNIRLFSTDTVFFLFHSIVICSVYDSNEMHFE